MLLPPLFLYEYVFQSSVASLAAAINAAILVWVSSNEEERKLRKDSKQKRNQTYSTFAHLFGSLSVCAVCFHIRFLSRRFVSAQSLLSNQGRFLTPSSFCRCGHYIGQYCTVRALLVLVFKSLPVDAIGVMYFTFASNRQPLYHDSRHFPTS